MKLSFITDEATQSFDEALTFAKEEGLNGLELRSVENMPIDQVPLERLRSWRLRLDRAGLSVPCIAGSFYKCSAYDLEAHDQEMEKLARLCDAADILGCDFIRGFAFFRPESGALSSSHLASLFESPAELLHRRNKRLLLEADPGVNTSNHQSLAELLSLLPAEVFGAVYDPGNNLYDASHEEPYPEGYKWIKPYLFHVHVKDVIYEKDTMPVCVAPGKGLVDWPAVLQGLEADGYVGWLSLETHYRKNVRLSENLMRLPQGNAFTKGGMEATVESARALRTLIEMNKKGSL